MSYKARLIKTAIKWTPKTLILWIGNVVLKGIASLGDFQFDLDTRKLYVKTTLYGEVEPIEVWVEDFALTGQDGGTYAFIIPLARSNKPWLTNILAHIVNKPWRIPQIPQLQPYMGLAVELLKPVHPVS